MTASEKGQDEEAVSGIAQIKYGLVVDELEEYEPSLIEDNLELGYPVMEDIQDLFESSEVGARALAMHVDSEVKLPWSEEKVPDNEDELRDYLKTLMIPPDQVVLRFFIGLKSKTGVEVTSGIQRMVLMIMKDFPVRTLHCDPGTEFTSDELKKWLSAQMIRLQHPLPADKQANGLAERTIGWCKARARTLLSATGISLQFWPLAIRYACETHNRIEKGMPPLPAFGTYETMGDDEVFGNVWKITTESGEVVGFAIIYVDDIMLLSTQSEAEKAYSWIREQWKCTPLQQAEEGQPVTFLGVDVYMGRDDQGNIGFMLCQSGYIQELLRCYSVVPKTRAAPVPKEWFKDMPEAESYTQEELRNAQKITGELLWVTQRSGVDLAYAVALMGSWTVRAPRVVKKIGMRLLEYLGATCDYRLSLIPTADAYEGVTAFSDASFAPYGCNSITGMLMLNQVLEWLMMKMMIRASVGAEGRRDLRYLPPLLVYKLE
ncbi:TY4B-P [Symbiodinium sp. KB8]|nr:TY4B-P [Symbiodinium sp. KB8]